MRKEKQNRNFSDGSPSLALILQWTVTYMVGFGALGLIIDVVKTDPYKTSFIGQSIGNWDFRIAWGLFGLVIPTLLQRLLVKRFLPGSAHGWFNLSVVGIILSGVILLVIHQFSETAIANRPDKFGLLIVLLLTPVSLVQTIWLIQKVKHAWIWPLASLLGTVAFISVFNNTAQAIPLALAGAVYGFLMGLMMFYLHIDVLWYSERFQGNG
jgi:hypothetical protein